MFKPIKEFSLFQEGSHFGNPSKNSSFTSELINDHINYSGVSINVYRLEGTLPQKRDNLNNKIDENNEETTDILSFLDVQDPILNENRDRKYDFDEIPMLKGVYQVSQQELEYLRFGLAMSNDIITMEFHTKNMETLLGRRMIPGDVIEMPHLREVDLLGRVANKWYEVSSLTWSPGGYDAEYGRHLMGVILKPLRNQQEFYDLLHNIKDEYGKTISEQSSTVDNMMNITERNRELSNEHSYTQSFDVTRMYFDPDKPDMNPYFMDARPPNGIPVDFGDSFPSNPPEKSWFLRTDFVPNKLYRYDTGKWRIREIDSKREWGSYNWIKTAQSHMTNIDDNGNKKNYKLKSVHDVITSREEKSDPTMEDS